MKSLFSKLDDESSSTLNMMNCEENPSNLIRQLEDDFGEGLFFHKQLTTTKNAAPALDGRNSEKPQLGKIWTSSGGVLRAYADYSVLFRELAPAGPEGDGRNGSGILAQEGVISKVRSATEKLKLEKYRGTDC